MIMYSPRRRREIVKRLTSIFLSIVVLVTACATSLGMSENIAYASTEIPREIALKVNDKSPEIVKVVDISYEGNAYASLRDVANLLSGTTKHFDVGITADSVNITTGKDYAPVGDEALNEKWTEADKSILKGHLFKNDIVTVDGRELRYYVLPVGYSDGRRDAFMMLADICMILDMEIEELSDEIVAINTNAELDINPAILEKNGYFEGVNSVLVGDATTGDIYYEYKGSEAFPIASTTKLISYAVLMDGVKKGEISLDDSVTISSAAEALSQGEDRVIILNAGEKTTLREILYAMLLPSSNECALAGAEHLCGSEKEFIERMHKLADDLGASTAAFYNCNGLPVFNGKEVPAKQHNRMSAEDMFKFASYILNTYPEVKEIATTKKYNMSTLRHQEIKNTNQLLYNLDNVTGLKTGTTNRAGCCLVSSYAVNKDGTEHQLVVVLLGAESTQDRFRVSQLLSVYGEDVLLGKSKSFVGEVTNPIEETHPQTAEGIVGKIVNSVR